MTAEGGKMSAQGGKMAAQGGKMAASGCPRLPYVAAYFAACGDDDEASEIWSFDAPQHEQAGQRQWECRPETTGDSSGTPSMLLCKRPLAKNLPNAALGDQIAGCRLTEGGATCSIEVNAL